jgi:hypothetical protein
MIDHGYSPLPPDLMHIWMSRTKDVVFETSRNPLECAGVCHYFGLTGVADKAIAMYKFMYDNHESKIGEVPVTTTWEEMTWSREYC